MIPATFSLVYKTCENKICKCHRKEKHGPYPAIQIKINNFTLNYIFPFFTVLIIGCLEKKLKFKKIFSKLDKEMIKTNISSRAANNYKECFAESIVLYAIDKSKLPEQILNFIEEEVL